MARTHGPGKRPRGGPGGTSTGGRRAPRFQLLAIGIIALGCCSILFRGYGLRGATTATEPSRERRDVKLVRKSLRNVGFIEHGVEDEDHAAQLVSVGEDDAQTMSPQSTATATTRPVTQAIVVPTRTNEALPTTTQAAPQPTTPSPAITEEPHNPAPTEATPDEKTPVGGAAEPPTEKPMTTALAKLSTTQPAPATTETTKGPLNSKRPTSQPPKPTSKKDKPFKAPLDHLGAAPSKTTEPADDASHSSSSSSSSGSIDPGERVPKALTPAELQRQRDECESRDAGLFENITRATRVFCPVGVVGSDGDGNGDRLPQSRPPTKATTVTVVSHAAAGLRAMVMDDLVLDLTHAKVFKPIKSLAQDGGTHDPRFRFERSMIYCGCDELAAHALEHKAATKNPLGLWDPVLALLPRARDDLSTVCGASGQFRPASLPTTDESLLEITHKVVLIARRDDHNPFFQIANALNVWVMLQVHGWDPNDVQVMHFDAGFPSPIDELQQRLLGPTQLILRGGELMGKRLHFTGGVMVAPFETTGPMMQHLEDYEPCRESALIKTFRERALEVMDAHPRPTRSEIIVTVITRKPYSGRVIQRRWRNEDEVVARLQTAYTAFHGIPIRFQSIDFVNLPLLEQMQFMLESDVVIGMHGAGMVNVLWTRPETLVLEIFPKKRKRWGYRNLCHYLGCRWKPFRGGRDIKTGKDDNANDKIISYEEWQPFFDEHFQKLLAGLDLSAFTPTSPSASRSTTTTTMAAATIESEAAIIDDAAATVDTTGKSVQLDSTAPSEIIQLNR